MNIVVTMLGQYYVEWDCANQQIELFISGSPIPFRVQYIIMLSPKIQYQMGLLNLIVLCTNSVSLQNSTRQTLRQLMHA